jgi:2-isopropylmalate synthase
MSNPITTPTKTIKIFDTTLRDGEQAPGFSMTTNEKVQIAIQLDKLGVDVIEAGFPVASPDDFKAVSQIAKVVQNAEVCGLSRANIKDIQTCWEAIKDAQKPRIHTFLATSPIHMEYKLKKTPDQILEMSIEAVRYAKNLCQRVTFSAEDGFRSDKDFLCKVFQAVIGAGADTVNLPDTVGYATPEEFGNTVKYVIENTPNIHQATLATHCHNDLGLAVANSLAGIKNGATEVQCTINGIGERAGNASLEEIVMILNTRKDYFNDMQTNIATTELYPTSRLISTITGVNVQPNKAIVGANAFAHESGIHQDGMLKNRQTYEIMTAESVGCVKNKLVLGKHSGRNAVFSRMAELNIPIAEDQKDTIFAQFKTLADQKKQVFDEDLYLLAFGNNTQDRWSIESVDGRCGTLPEATVAISDFEHNHFAITKTGNGAVEAIFKCIDEITKTKPTLEEYSVLAVTEGIDAQAVVAVKVVYNDKTFSAKASDLDITVASAKAYLEAINKIDRFGKM